MSSGLWRLLHWGPCVALGIIKWVTISTLYCASMLWPPAESLWGLVFSLLFSCLSSLTLYHFTCALTHGPGFLPAHWSPDDDSACSALQYCSQCQGYKAPRSHHCRRCGRCVMKMDHHCPWINTCVGHLNHGHFVAFLASAVTGCSLATVCLAMSLYYGLNRTWYLYYGTGHEPQVILSLWSLLGALFGMGLALGVVIAVGMLLFFQIKAILKNQTGIEDWIKEKADFRLRHTDRKFQWPYDLGRRENMSQVLGLSCRPEGDGITWRLAEGCDQYTLTREQLKQKEDKRERTREYQIVRSYSGYWFPLSQGVGVCCHPPCTDEPRIRLAPAGNIVRVTRWKKYWLYGELAQQQNTELAQQQPGTDTSVTRVRGWFPRQCVVEILDHADHGKHHSSKKKD